MGLTFIRLGQLETRTQKLRAALEKIATGPSDQDAKMIAQLAIDEDDKTDD
jgi:hypothetical protein